MWLDPEWVPSEPKASVHDKSKQKTGTHFVVSRAVLQLKPAHQLTVAACVIVRQKWQTFRRLSCCLQPMSTHFGAVLFATRCHPMLQAAASCLILAWINACSERVDSNMGTVHFWCLLLITWARLQPFELKWSPLNILLEQFYRNLIESTLVPILLWLLFSVLGFHFDPAYHHILHCLKEQPPLSCLQGFSIGKTFGEPGWWVWAL